MPYAASGILRGTSASGGNPLKPKGLFFIAAVSLGFAACSHDTGFRAAYDSYRPPSIASVPAAAPDAPQHGVLADTAFADTKRQIEQMRLEWETSLDPAGKDDRFYRPASEKWNNLEPAAGDMEAAAHVLQTGFPLETLEILVLLRNPGVISAEHAFKGKLQAYSQIESLDDILQQYAAFTRAVMPGFGKTVGTASPEMNFPFPGILSLKGEIVQQDIRIAREALEISRRSAVTAARKGFWNLVYNCRARDVTGEMLGLAGQLERSVRNRYEVGNGQLPDIIRVQVQQANLRETLRTLEETSQTLLADIRSLVDLPSDKKIGMPAVREPRRHFPSVDALESLAMEKRQELRMARAVIGRTERMIEIYPHVTQNLSLFENDAVNQVGSIRFEEPFAVTAAASTGQGLPINPWAGLNHAYLMETRENLKEFRSNLVNTENETRYKVREGWFALDLALREEKLYDRKIVDLSHISAETARQRYELGTTELKEVVEFYLSWLEARLAGERSRSDIEIARAGLEEVVGTSF